MMVLRLLLVAAASPAAPHASAPLDIRLLTLEDLRTRRQGLFPHLFQALVIVAALAISACGGSGGTTPAPKPSGTLSLLVLSPNTPVADGADSITATATVKDGSGAAMSGKDVR